MSTSATSISVPSATDIAPSTNDSASLRIVAIVIPVILIAAFVLWVLLVAAGVMSSTTRFYHTSTTSPSRRHRYEEYVEEPKLWEVQTTTSEVKPQLEDLNPLSMDLFSDLDHGGKNATTSFKTKLGFRAIKKWRKRARSTTPLPQSKCSDLESQVTVFVAMPTPGRRMAGHTMHEFAIGTRSMAYSGIGEQVVIPPKQSSPALIRPCSSRTSSLTEVPIMAELSAYGYFF